MMRPVTFVHVDTGQRVLCRTDAMRARWFDNRHRADWLTVPATDDDLRWL